VGRGLLAVVIGLSLTAGQAGATSQAVRWFHSPSGNIQCEVASADVRGTYAYCQTFTPLQTAKLKRDGRTAVCSHRACSVGDGPENATTLAYGHSLRVGVFRCWSSQRGIRCVVIASGHGFTIARAGISTF
jgi:hypothetical protein